VTIYVYIERDLAAGEHKSSRFRCKLAVPGNMASFMSVRNYGSIAAAKRNAEELFKRSLNWHGVDDPVVRVASELEL
jgi:hypothetical protein